ncbi:MAG: hypothetical protein K2Y21_13705 [Phycisphaerales bacterium]|nr:hypothetical protein [Phycisphaerales bacterium]
MIEPGMSEWGDAKGPTPPASGAGRVFGAVVMSVFLVLWLTVTIGISRLAAGVVPGVFGLVPLLMAVLGTLVIGSGILGILFGRKSPPPLERGGEIKAPGAVRPAAADIAACAYCGVRGELTRTNCSACGAPNRG